MGCSIRSSEGGDACTSTIAEYKDQGQETTGCTKHVDLCYKFVTEYFEDGIIKIILVKSANNDSDIMTKNLGSEIHSKHASKMISANDILWQMGYSIWALALGETPTYQVKEHCVWTLNWSRQKGGVSKME